ncbi:MAG TPA: HAMP domain-containing sensor histidine kinase [Actinomycetes bacterium]|jgi:signal transduction histidine kinase|nr:HAMP domain-containing sensor histidine kinase [Actinomycetes bacterium]
MNFRTRLTLAYLLLLTLTLTIFGLGVYAYVDRRLHAEVFNSVQNQGHYLGSLLYSYDAAKDIYNTLGSQAQKGNERPKPNPDTYIQVLEGTTKQRATWATESKYPPQAMSEINLPRVTNSRVTIVTAEPSTQLSKLGSSLAVYSEQFQASKVTPPGSERIRVNPEGPKPSPEMIFGEVTVARSLDGVESSLRSLRTILLAGGLAVLLAAALLGSGLAAALLRPLARMRTTAQAIGDARDFTRRMPVEGNPRNPRDELARLSTSFNQMLDELERSHVNLQNTLDAQRRFVADASHELRTPITAIRTNAEFLSRVPGARPEDREAALKDVLAEMRRMEALVGDLLALARLEAATRPVPRRAFRLDHLLADIHRDAARHATDGVDVRVGAMPEAWVLGDRDDLRRGIWNLIDNALKYTRAGWVQLSLAVRDGRAEVRIADSGMGIAEAEVERVFDRFWRAPGVRGMAGSGLGLAITKWVVELHGGTISLESEVGRGTVFIVGLPVTTRGRAARRLQRQAALAAAANAQRA